MKRYVRSDTNSPNTDFEIRDGVLVRYNGNSKNVVVPSGVTVIGDSAFYQSRDSIECVVLPDLVEEIQSYSFARCKNLKKIRFSRNLKLIANYAFSSCESLIQVDIPASVEVIEHHAFSDCSNLTDVKLHSGLIEIGDNCFAWCENLKSIVVPETVKTIGSFAFFNCTNLKNVKIPNIKVPENAFFDSDAIITKYAYNDENNQDSEHESIDEWYMSSDGEIDNDKFAEKLENLVRNDFDVSDYFEEPSIQGFSGADNISIKLNDGSEYSFSFSWYDMQEKIFGDGPDKAAKYYFNEIKEGIESGSASTDTPTL